MIDSIVSWVSELPVGIRWISILGFLYVLAFALQPGSWLQFPVTFLFLTICPGLLLIDWMDFPEFVFGLTMVVASSLAINILVTVVLAGAGTYSPFTGMVATISTTLALAYISYAKQGSITPSRLPMRIS
jgi:hypothetical protein